MHELIRLLREFGTIDEEAIALVERFISEDENAEPLADGDLDVVIATLTTLAEDPEASLPLLNEALPVASSAMQEATRREEEAAAEEAERERIAAELRGLREPAAEDETPTEPEGEEPEGDDGDESDKDGDEPEAPADGDQPADEPATADAKAAPEPVAASATPARRPVARRSLRRSTPPAAQPVENDPGPGFTITFGADLAGIAAGSRAEGLPAVDRALRQRAESFRRSNATHWEKVHVATVRRDPLPEERRLVDARGRSLAPHEASERVQSVIASAIAEARRANGGRALVAAGGLCAPLQPIYDVSVLGETGRPVRDTALVSFQAGRGGVISTAPPTISSVTGAIGAWTVTNDEDATDGTPTKAKMRIECGTPRETEIEAITRILVIGNLLARTYGEWVDAVSTAVMVAHDRFAEERHLARMRALSHVTTVEASQVSATLDTLDAIRRAIAGMRSRHRLSRSFPFRVVLPEILLSVMQTDLSRRMPSGTLAENLVVSEQLLGRAFAEMGANVTWTPDLNVQGAQGHNTALHEWPDEFHFLVYPEGTFIHLDSGELDLGTVRDSALNEVNDAELFAESFENVHLLGTESIAGTVSVCPSGGTVGTIDPADVCGANS